MLSNRYAIGGAIIAVLIVANILSYLLSGWGLITVKVHEAPLGQVLKTIERQGWVTIYSDMDLTTPVSMYVDHVPLAEAMETLTANLGGPGGGAQWKLGFFVAPTSSQVKNEIHSFESGATDDDAKVYSFPTPLNMLAGAETEMPAADPRLQTWPGLKTPDPTLTPAATGDDPPPTAPEPPSTMQDYLEAFAEQSDIWVLAPGSWDPKVSGAPAAGSSLIHAVKSLVSSANGAVEEAIVLRQVQRGRGQGPRGGNRGGDTGWMVDRLQSAIQGLPAAARPAAQTALNQEIQFQHNVQAAPPDQRRAMWREHRMRNMGGNFWRMSPEKRAQMYQRVVGNRETARGQ